MDIAAVACVPSVDLIFLTYLIFISRACLRDTLPKGVCGRSTIYKVVSQERHGAPAFLQRGATVIHITPGYFSAYSTAGHSHGPDAPPLKRVLVL